MQIYNQDDPDFAVFTTHGVTWSHPVSIQPAAGEGSFEVENWNWAKLPDDM